MDDSELQSLWKRGTGAVGAEPPPPHRASRPRLVAPYLTHRLRLDLVLKAILVLALGIIGFLPWRDASGPIVAALACAATIGMAWPIAVAMKRLTGKNRLDEDLRTSSADLLAEVLRSRRNVLLSLSATGGLLPLAFVLAYAASEYGSLGGLRPGTGLFSLGLVVLTGLATGWAISRRIEAIEARLVAFLDELDPGKLESIAAHDREARRVLLLVMVPVSVLIATGIAIALLLQR